MYAHLKNGRQKTNKTKDQLQSKRSLVKQGWSIIKLFQVQDFLWGLNSRPLVWVSPPPFWGPPFQGPPVWGPMVCGPMVVGPQDQGPKDWGPQSGQHKTTKLSMPNCAKIVTTPLSGDSKVRISSSSSSASSYYGLQDAASQMLRPRKNLQIQHDEANLSGSKTC